MELSLLLTKQILSMGLMILMGFTVVKTKLLTSESSNVLSAFVIYVISPCTLFNSFQVDYTSERLSSLLIAFVISILIHVIFILLARAARDLFQATNVERASLIYTNATNLIIPLVAATLGSEMIFYTSAFIVAQHLFNWTHHVRLLAPGQSSSLKKIVTNPNVIAIFLGIIFFLGRFRLPSIAAGTIDTVGSTIGVFSMFMIGMVMGSVDFRKTFSKPRLYLVSLCRLVLFPLIFILLVWVSGVTRRVPVMYDVLMVTLLAASAPSAVMVTQFANLWGSSEDAKDAGAINVMTVLFCIVTMPIMVWLYQIIL